MRIAYARRNKNSIIDEPICLSSREKRSLCKHCRLNPITPAVEHVEIVSVATVRAEWGTQCQLRKEHTFQRNDQIGLAVFTGDGNRQRIGWVCPECVAGLPFCPEPAEHEAEPARTVTDVPKYSWRH